MLISSNFKNQYLENLKKYLPHEIVQNNGFEEAVFSSLDDLIELSSQEVCEARIKGLELTCQFSDLAERLLNVQNGNEFIAGARFKNLNINFPFIEIHVGFNLTADLIKEISEIVRKEFKNISPKGMKFKYKPFSYSNLEKWSHTVFGKIENHNISFDQSKISYKLSKDLDWYSLYQSEYKERLLQKIELDGFVRIGEIDEFEESADNQTMLVLNDNQGFCGVIAGIDNPYYGLPAIYMIESFLSERWIGKNIAPMAHNSFLNLISNKYNYVWGTIYDKNVSSLKTALRVGRHIVETEYFVQFE